MTPRPRTLTAGLPTSIGSLPHVDAAAAAQLVLAKQPTLPAVPELPGLRPAEGMIERWLRFDDPANVQIDEEANAGAFAFVAAAAADPPRAVKAQVAGPLTLGVALVDSGIAPTEAFERAARLSEAAAAATVGFLAKRLPHSEAVLFLDEPALTAWASDSAPIEREQAVDILSGVLAGIDAVTGVHVCGEGDRRMAIEAGPAIVGFEVRPSVLDDGVAIARYLDAGGWIAWGAVPTDRPVGERVEHWWKALVSLWCDLTRGGCDPVTLRTQALITPACGLAGHSEDQAATILDLCVEIGERVREQAIATRLTVGA
ncbi:MAG: hypothetical protein HYU28_03260 [Actinobacteria bacterium]|nr:hypothetical protein [Actinomycetota bacterium]